MTTIHAAPSTMLRPALDQKPLPVMKLDPGNGPKTASNAQGLPVMKMAPGARSVGPNANGLPVMKMGPALANASPTVNGLPIMQIDPSGETETGTVQSSTDGDGSFTRTTSMVDGHKVVDTSVSYTDGKTRSHERSVTLNPDGSKTVTVTNQNGKTKTITESATKNSDGSVSIAKQVTKANGDVTTISGTVMKLDGETQKHLTETNADGKTETLDVTSSHTGNIAVHHRTGTGYDGQSIDKSSTWTTYA